MNAKRIAERGARRIERRRAENAALRESIARRLVRADQLEYALDLILRHVGGCKGTDFKQPLPLSWEQALETAREVLAATKENTQ